MSQKMTQIGPSVLRTQFAHQFSARVAQRLQKVQERLPRAFVKLGVIKTAAYHVVKVGHRSQQVGLGFWRHVCLQTVARPAYARPSSAAKLVTQTVVVRCVGTLSRKKQDPEVALRALFAGHPLLPTLHDWGRPASESE